MNDELNNIDSAPDIGGLLEMLRGSGKVYDLGKITRAYEYAEELHKGQTRLSGEAYIVHPVAVAMIVAELELDTDAVCAALLHDTVEDCPETVSMDKIRRDFSEETAELVDGLTKLVRIRFETKEDENIENLRKMFLAMSKDIRVIFIKLSDRLHNMRTLSSMPEAKQRLTALETMHVYAPLAHRLGIERIKSELEMLALRHLDPIGFGEVKDSIDKKFGLHRDFLENNRMKIHERLNACGIAHTIEGRVKSVYGTYKKMYNQNKDFEEIYDFYAMRVIVETELDCYTVLGVIHDMFKYMPGRFKDYISMPKPNLYRSLHTTVIGRDGVPFEIQIRTREMHRIAEYGIAAHWKYKDVSPEGAAGARGAEDEKDEISRKLQWIRTLLETEKDPNDPDEFLNPLKIDLYENETFVYTPKGDVINLPSGATVIDFAYAIHSAIGNKMTGGKINGVIVPIDTVLQNGQIVEIITSNSSTGPSRDWMKSVRTGEAKNKIRQWFKKEKRTENIAVGRSEIEAEFRRVIPAAPAFDCTNARKEEILLNVARRIGIQEIDDLYNTIGYGGMSVRKISQKIRDEYERLAKLEAPPITDVSQVETVERPKKKRGEVMVSVGGIDSCQIKFAKCCNPLPGDDIIGFITKGFGVSIHKADCPNVAQGRKNLAEVDRWIKVDWSPNAAAESGSDSDFEAMIQIFALYSNRLIADITSRLADMRVDILSIKSQKKQDYEIIIYITVSVRSIDHIKAILTKIVAVDGVQKAVRGFS